MIIILAAITCITCIICALIICFYKNKWEPNYWSRISKVDYLHHSKEAQSPIIISPSHLAKRQDISFHYLPSELDILNNGNTIQMKLMS
jgi:carbonic anhydrase